MTDSFYKNDFKAGDMIKLNAREYIVSINDELEKHKIGIEWYGPFRIKQKIGETSYEIELPSLSKGRRIVHKSKIKFADKDDGAKYMHSYEEPSYAQLYQKFCRVPKLRTGQCVHCLLPIEKSSEYLYIRLQRHEKCCEDNWISYLCDTPYYDEAHYGFKDYKIALFGSSYDNEKNWKERYKSI